MTGQKRKRKDCEGYEEFFIILAKFIEVTEECDTKRLAEAEMEEKQMEQEWKHKERMLTMMGFMQRMVGCPPTSSQHHSPSASRPFHMPSYPFTPCPDFPHSSPTSPFSPDHTFTTPTSVVTPSFSSLKSILLSMHRHRPCPFSLPKAFSTTILARLCR